MLPQSDLEFSVAARGGDFDYSGVTNEADAAAFADAYANSNVSADMNGDGLVTGDDLSIFVERYEP